MQYQYNDGGRAAAGFKGETGDCVTRAIAIATGDPYQQVYNALWHGLSQYAENSRSRYAKRIRAGGGKRGTTPRNGIGREIYEPYLLDRGFVWHATMAIGQGCNTHLRDGEVPSGTVIARVSRHLVTIINGIIHDTYDCSRAGTRCVYGFYEKVII